MITIQISLSASGLIPINNHNYTIMDNIISQTMHIPMSQPRPTGEIYLGLSWSNNSALIDQLDLNDIQINETTTPVSEGCVTYWNNLECDLQGANVKHEYDGNNFGGFHNQPEYLTFTGANNYWHFVYAENFNKYAMHSNEAVLSE